MYCEGVIWFFLNMEKRAVEPGNADLCWSAALEVCGNAEEYINKTRQKRKGMPLAFLRAVAVRCQDSVHLSRVSEVEFHRCGGILQMDVRRASDNLLSDCMACWLTLTTEDNPLVLQHAFFSIAAGKSEPIGMRITSAQPKFGRPFESTSFALVPVPSPMDLPSAHPYKMPTDMSCTSSPEVGGRNIPQSQPIMRPKDVVEQSDIFRPRATVSCQLSSTLPRLQTSAPYVVKNVDPVPSWVSKRERQLVVSSLDETVLVEPSPYSHQKPDGARRDLYSPQREDLWGLAEKSMTRYTGITWIGESKEGSFIEFFTSCTFCFLRISREDLNVSLTVRRSASYFGITFQSLSTDRSCAAISLNATIEVYFLYPVFLIFFSRYAKDSESRYGCAFNNRKTVLIPLAQSNVGTLLNCLKTVLFTYSPNACWSKENLEMVHRIAFALHEVYPSTSFICQQCAIKQDYMMRLSDNLERRRQYRATYYCNTSEDSVVRLALVSDKLIFLRIR
eukprot:gene4552-3314_t